MLKAARGHPDVQKSEAGDQRVGKEPSCELLRAVRVFSFELQTNVNHLSNRDNKSERAQREASLVRQAARLLLNGVYYHSWYTVSHLCYEVRLEGITQAKRGKTFGSFRPNLASDISDFRRELSAASHFVFEGGDDILDQTFIKLRMRFGLKSIIIANQRDYDLT